MLYAQVDKKKVRKKSASQSATTPAAEMEVPRPLDQLYAQVDKKKEKKKASQTATSNGDSSGPAVCSWTRRK